jgi:hypothetical protein
MAFWYSVRLRRWKGSVRPGFGAAAADRSSSRSSQPASASCVALSGRGEPAGGMTPARSFKTTFSHAAGSAVTSSTRSVSSATGTMPRLFIAWLWQEMQ